MKNVHSSDSIAEDIIRSFTQLACGEAHLKTLLDKATSELEGGLVDASNEDELNKQLEKINALQDELDGVAQARRRMMLKLFKMYDGDKTYWCMVKHLAIASYAAFEAWQASDHDDELLDLANEAQKQFVKILSHFIGTEITDCSACFGDMLKGDKHE